ncbi:MAG: DUF4870 domain-containing protein [Ruminococcus sp.]|nr:DUF4870 domain-containing protein [Ruminococcus sp.]
MENYNVMGNDHTNEFGTQEIAEAKVVSVLAYIPILFWLPLVTVKNNYGKFHANQGLNLLLFGFVMSIASAVIGAVLGWIPLVGGIICTLVDIVVAVAEIGLMIYGMVNTGNGKAKELPLIGGLLTLIK